MKKFLAYAAAMVALTAASPATAGTRPFDYGSNVRLKNIGHGVKSKKPYHGLESAMKHASEHGRKGLKNAYEHQKRKYKSRGC